MKARFLDWLRELRASYWFVPTLMASAAVALSLVTVMLDGRIGDAWLSDVDWLYANKPDGARAVLSTLAGSMITVAGVTFSMTILTVSFAAGQIGPRLMNNFMRDRGNQITLGTFISTFLYCLMVLRTVRNAEEAVPGVDPTMGAFVPHISLLLALLMAIASVGVLIYFIHHVPESINVSNVIARVGRDLNDMVESEFPTTIGQPADRGEGEENHAVNGHGGAEDPDHPDTPPPIAGDPTAPGPGTDAAAIKAHGNGYLRTVDGGALMRLAQRHDLCLRLEYRPGDYVCHGKVLLYAWPRERVEPGVADRLRETFALGTSRTRHQNMFFLVDELAEIIARALSPGVNDPFTAISCMDWVQSVLLNLGRREPVDPRRFDADHRLRVVTHPIRFEAMVQRICGQTLSYVSTDPNASLHMMKMIAEVAAELPPGPRREAVLEQATRLRTATREGLSLEVDRQAIDARYQQLLAAVHNRAAAARLRDDQGWLGGTG